jgi:hypothetical protein
MYLSSQLLGKLKTGTCGPDRPEQKARPYLQNDQNKRVAGVTKVVQHLPSKCKALSSNSSTATHTHTHTHTHKITVSSRLI